MSCFWATISQSCQVKILLKSFAPTHMIPKVAKVARWNRKQETKQLVRMCRKVNEDIEAWKIIISSNAICMRIVIWVDWWMNSTVSENVANSPQIWLALVQPDTGMTESSTAYTKVYRNKYYKIKYIFYIARGGGKKKILNCDLDSTLYRNVLSVKFILKYIYDFYYGTLSQIGIRSQWPQTQEFAICR